MVGTVVEVLVVEVVVVEEVVEVVGPEKFSTALDPGVIPRSLARLSTACKMDTCTRTSGFARSTSCW